MATKFQTWHAMVLHFGDGWDVTCMGSAGSGPGKGPRTARRARGAGAWSEKSTCKREGIGKASGTGGLAALSGRHPNGAAGRFMERAIGSGWVLGLARATITSGLGWVGRETFA